MSESSAAETKKPLLSNAVYNVLKTFATVYLPGLGALYFALAQIWNFPHTEEVVGTIAAVNTFLGLALGISSATYNSVLSARSKYAGEIQVGKASNGNTVYSLVVNGEPADIENHDEATFKVNKV